MSKFEGKTVLITGCARARGMGRAIAVAFARAGADVVATDVASGGTRNENEEGLEEIRLGWKGLESLATEVEGLGRRILTLVGDVSRAADVDRMVADALGRFGRLDVLVNNAAAPHGAHRRLFWEVPEEAWNAVLGVNLKGVYLMSRAVIPQSLRLRAERPHHRSGLDRGRRDGDALITGCDRGKGAAPCGAAPCREASADQLCQRNSCGLRADSWEIRTLTSAGPGKSIASCKAPFRSFGSSMKKPLPPKASIILS
jgi:NAD(P)-dependent dehydrogenase (short-subunit alcohol dehydrogenase family)